MINKYPDVYVFMKNNVQHLQNIQNVIIFKR